MLCTSYYAGENIVVLYANKGREEWEETWVGFGRGLKLSRQEREDQKGAQSVDKFQSLDPHSSW